MTQNALNNINIKYQNGVNIGKKNVSILTPHDNQEFAFTKKLLKTKTTTTTLRLFELAWKN